MYVHVHVHVRAHVRVTFRGQLAWMSTNLQIVMKLA